MNFPVIVVSHNLTFNEEKKLFLTNLTFYEFISKYIH